MPAQLPPPFSACPPLQVLIGLGELGRYFGAGLLRQGHPVLPLRRQDPAAERIAALPGGTPLWWTVGEKDAPRVLDVVGAGRGEDVILVQNEIFAPVWRQWGLREPTVAVVWTSVKPGELPTVGIRSAVFGRHAESVMAAHAGAGVPCVTLDGPQELTTELVAKYAMILAFNALGLEGTRTVEAWLEDAPRRVAELLEEGVRLGCALATTPADREAAQERAHDGLAGLRTLKAGGRSAPARVARALTAAQVLGIALPALSAAADRHSDER